MQQIWRMTMHCLCNLEKCMRFVCERVDLYDIVSDKVDIYNNNNNRWGRFVFCLFSMVLMHACLVEWMSLSRTVISFILECTERERKVMSEQCVYSYSQSSMAIQTSKIKCHQHSYNLYLPHNIIIGSLPFFLYFFFFRQQNL